jgi:HD-GYP domain-containing protein (c-di-GMP phosphodiesterase class II)
MQADARHRAVSALSFPGLSSNEPGALAILQRREKKLSALLDVAKAMSAQRDLFGLIQLVVKEAAAVVAADRGTVWLLDREKSELFTYVAEGMEGRELRIPMTAGIAGVVAGSGRSLKVPDAYADTRFNRDSDVKTGYRTRNIMAVPMWSVDNQVFGVLQVLNKRTDVDDGRFTEEDQEFLTAFGGQAASALQSALLYDEIQKLFEGFIKASVYAIEARDPTTSGHSERVAILTTGLAESMDRGGGAGRWKGVKFTVDEMREIRYASLLHDFGKVGVREDVLVKANKLYPYQTEILKHRFDFVRRSLEAQAYQKKIELLFPAGGAAVKDLLEQEDAKLQKAYAELDELQNFVMNCNRPTVLEQGGFERLQEIEKRTYRNMKGEELPFLSKDEVISLSIPRGSLTVVERKEIESHVTHTYQFLRKIPWSRSLQRVPEIAHGHHEKLDGKGYPLGLPADVITVQTRMMTISDIYDALTASDRPYKKAVPHVKALDILRDEAKKGFVDADCLQVFVEADVPQKLPKHPD